MPLAVASVVNALLCSDELYCPSNQSDVGVAGATNAITIRQSEAVTVIPMLLTPPPLPTGILHSSHVRSHPETKMATLQTQRSISTIIYDLTEK